MQRGDKDMQCPHPPRTLITSILPNGLGIMQAHIDRLKLCFFLTWSCGEYLVSLDEDCPFLYNQTSMADAMTD